MITEVVKIQHNPDGTANAIVPQEIVSELYTKGLAFPDVMHVTYNSGIKKIYKLDKDGNRVLDSKTKKPIILDSYPILTTIVEWSTGDKTIVTNSKLDGLSLDKNGRPTEFAKECGFAFAVTKKMLTSRYEINENNELTIIQDGFGTKLTNVVKNATDLQELEELKKKQKAESDKRKKEAEAQHLAKINAPKRLSLAEAMDKLAIALKEIEELKSKNAVKPSSSKKTVVKKSVKAK